MDKMLVAACIATAAMVWPKETGGQSLPPIRSIGQVQRVSAPHRLSSAAAVRSLPDGRAIVNDIVGHRLVVFDSTFADVSVIIDSANTTGGTLGTQVGGIIPFRGDSTIFVDPSTLSLLVIDSRGRIARVMAAPRADGIAFLVGGPFGTPGFDAAGRLISRGTARAVPASATTSTSGASIVQMPQQPDSAPIVRFDLATRKMDTVGLIKTPRSVTRFARADDGNIIVTLTLNPMQLLDDWALLSDGTLAIVRGRDYHIDWVTPDRAMIATPKMPFAWHRMTDVDKTALLDSARVAVDKDLAMMRSKLSTRSAPVIDLVPASDLPEYRPPFEAGAVRADPNGRLWIRTTGVTEGSVYDIVDRSGEIIDRVRLPRGRVLVGFGQHATIFMAFLDGAGGGARVEEARLR